MDSDFQEEKLRKFYEEGDYLGGIEMMIDFMRMPIIRETRFQGTMRETERAGEAADYVSYLEEAERIIRGERG